MVALPQTQLREKSAELEQAFRAEAAGLLGYFIRRVMPTEDAADLVSETFLAAWKSPQLHKISPDMLRPWLFGIARNVLSQHRRGHLRRSALSDKLRANINADLTAQLNGTASALDQDLAAHVRQLISALSETDQEIITLVYWEGFTQEEIATILGKRATTVRSRLSRARALLAEELAATD